MTTNASYPVPKLAAEVARLIAGHPLVDAVVDQIDGRMIRVGDHWLADFASCNYLGLDLDLDLEIIAGIPDSLERWGTHPSWARGIASPALYSRVEAVVRELLGAEDVLAFPTLTHIHNGVLPALTREGTLLVDNRSHRTLHDAAVIAKARGASVRRFRSGDVEQVERLLRGSTLPRVVCMDGVNSMTGNPPDLHAFAALAREHDATLYVDDAHGFGVIGERSGYDPSPYGRRGNGIVRWFGESYDHVVLAAGFSKAYSSLLAFAAVSTQLKQFLKVMVPAYVYGGPVPVASLASSLLGLQVNERRGDELRALLHHRTRTVLDHLDKLGVATSNISGFPLIELAIADPEDLDAVGRLLFDHGIYVTLAPYPVVPRDEVGFRVQLTAANTAEQVDQLLTVLQEVDDRFGFRRPHP